MIVIYDTSVTAVFAASHHFVYLDILNFGPFLPNGLVKIHKFVWRSH